MRNRGDATASLLSKYSWSTSLAAPNWGTCHLLIYWPIVQLNHGHFADRILRNSHPSRMAKFVLIWHPRVRVSAALSWRASRRVVLITARALLGQGEGSWLRRSYFRDPRISGSWLFNWGAVTFVHTLSAELRNLLCVPLLSSGFRGTPKLAIAVMGVRKQACHYSVHKHIYLALMFYFYI